MRISDWSSEVCSSDLDALGGVHAVDVFGTGFDTDEDHRLAHARGLLRAVGVEHDLARCRTRARGKPLGQHVARRFGVERRMEKLVERARIDAADGLLFGNQPFGRSEEHTSELQSLMRISYAVFCLKKKK